MGSIDLTRNFGGRARSSTCNIEIFRSVDALKTLRSLLFCTVQSALKVVFSVLKKCLLLQILLSRLDSGFWMVRLPILV